MKPIYECTGCGRVTREPDADLQLLRKAGHQSCCPERDMRPMPTTDDAQITTRQLAARWKKKEHCVRNMRSKGEGPPYIKDGGVRYLLSDIIAWEQAHKIQPEKEQ